MLFLVPLQNFSHKFDTEIKIYVNLSDLYHFEQYVGVETLDSLGPRGLNLIKMIGNKLKQATGEPR